MKKSKLNKPLDVSDKPLSQTPIANVPGAAPLFTSDQLMEALYYCWDFMERALINFYLVGNTAEACLTKHLLAGDKIMIAVRKNEWESGARRIADAFALPSGVELTPHGEVYNYGLNGVPIYLHVLEDSVTMQQADTVMYQREFFKIPSPYPQFLKEYPWLIR